MYGVVYNGLSSAYKANNVVLIGKTGTAQIASPNGGYMTGKYDTIKSFAGMFPKDDPKYIVYFSVKQLVGSANDMGVVLSKAVEEVAKYANITTEESDLDTSKIIEIPNFINKDISEISNFSEINKLQPIILGNGEQVIKQFPLNKQTVVIGNKLFVVLFMITMYFSGGLIPTFLVVNGLGLYNTRMALLILGAFSVYNCIICRSFFAAIPKELEESAYIDGCNVIHSFVRIVLPLSKALLGVMVLYFAVGHWNAYFNALIYVRDESMQPLQIFLRRILILAKQQTDSEQAGELAGQLIQREALIRYASIVVSALPLMILYPCLQKFFDKGVLIGSVKG